MGDGGNGDDTWNEVADEVDGDGDDMGNEADEEEEEDEALWLLFAMRTVRTRLEPGARWPFSA